MTRPPAVTYMPMPRTNDPAMGAVSWRQAKAALLHPRFFDGFQEVMAGRPFDYDRLDRLTPGDQVHYENGREVGTEALSRGLRIDWRQRDRIPRDLKDLVIGRALRRARVEPRTDPYRRRPGGAPVAAAA